MNDILHSHDMNVHYHTRTGSMMYTGKAMEAKSAPAKNPDADETSSDLHENWGDDNNYPQYVLDQVKDVTLVEPILDWKARALYGGGLAYGLLRYDGTEEIFEPLIDAEIEDWMEGTDIMQYLMDASVYFYYYYNIFPALNPSVDKKKIVHLTCKESTDCRWGKRERSGNRKGTIAKCFMSPDWAKYDAKSKATASFSVFNPFLDSVESLKSQKKLEEFIYPVYSTSPGRAYYQRGPWHNLFKTWLPIAKAIPEFKQALLKNQLTIKYIIRVPEWWWSWKYKDWDRKSESDRLKLIKKEHEDFDKFFSGEKQGGSIMYTQRDSIPSKVYGAWEVEVIDDKVKTGMYIEDSQEADAHIFKNMQVDQTLFGNGAGKGVGAGSGSDKRVAFNTYSIVTKPHQDLILKPLHFISRYNGWQERLAGKGYEKGKLVFWMKNYMIARLDSGKETKQKTPAGDETTD